MATIIITIYDAALHTARNVLRADVSAIILSLLWFWVSQDSVEHRQQNLEISTNHGQPDRNPNLT